ncbi:MAG: class I SAM-dependent methyltransferase [Candidatus Paceibacterota bacterium]|jgi:SAM-dependent methyltransferase
MDQWAPRIYTPQGFTPDNILGEYTALELGCGDRKLPGAVGIDILKFPSVDIVHDLSIFPWPIQNARFDLVFANHLLEHANDVVRTMEEIHRVLKPGGRAVIQVPYFRSTDAYGDPTHKHFFTSKTLDFFIEGARPAEYGYTPIRFKKIGFWYGWPHHPHNPLRRAFKSFMHKHSQFYDQYLSVYVPVKCLTWELEAIA